MKKISLVIACFLLAGCSWSTNQIGPNDYQLSGYFDFTMKGSVVVQGLEMDAQAYCKTVGVDFVPQIYEVHYQNRVFNYEANRANAVIRFHCVKPNTK